MPKVTKLCLAAEQVEELTTARDRHPKAYIREKAAAILKVSAGQSIRQVALHGLHKRRSEHTVKDWIERYLEEGLAGLQVKAGRGRKAVFFPLSPMEAEQAVEYLLHQSPRQYGITQTRWRLQDVGRVLKWLDGCTEPGIYKLLKRLGFSRTKALYFIYRPDPAYRAKWQQILAAYQEAVTQPAEVILLFQDEFTYYRRAELRQSWQRRGRRQRRRYHRAGANTKARVTAVLNGLTGQVIYRQRHKIGAKELSEFYAQVRAVYPTVKRIYLVQDNWPVHKLPAVMQAASANNLTLLFLPTYASWLNPIEKLWRWLRQAILHDHDLSHNFKQLRPEVVAFLDQFAQGSLKLLNYVGLLSEEELSSMCQLIC